MGALGELLGAGDFVHFYCLDVGVGWRLEHGGIGFADLEEG